LGGGAEGRLAGAMLAFLVGMGADEPCSHPAHAATTAPTTTSASHGRRETVVANTSRSSCRLLAVEHVDTNGHARCRSDDRCLQVELRHGLRQRPTWPVVSGPAHATAVRSQSAVVSATALAAQLFQRSDMRLSVTTN